MNHERISEIRRLYNAARKGKWTIEPCMDKNCWCKCVGCPEDEDNKEQGVIGSGCVSARDAELIVALHNATPEMLKMFDWCINTCYTCRTLHNELDEKRKPCEDCVSYCNWSPAWERK